MRGDIVGPALGAAAATAAAGLLAVTTLSQHPDRMFDRLREFDSTGMLIPNWRFFAPEPASHDFHILHRVRTADGRTTPWVETNSITARRLSHLVWFPARRREKAVFDVANELVMAMPVLGGRIVEVPSYRLLLAMVARRVRDQHDQAPQGFQLMVAKGAGHDDDEEPEYLFVSPYVALDADGHPVRSIGQPRFTHRPVAADAVPAL